MLPGYMGEYLAQERRRELSREARQAALAAEATPDTSGIWTAALLLLADVLVHAGQRLRVRLGRGQVAHAAHAQHAHYGVDALCQGGSAACEHVVWLDV